MIHAYNDSYLELTQDKLGTMFELAKYAKDLDVDSFADLFVSSIVCKAFEERNPIFVAGKSANELLGLILNEDPIDVEQNMNASPEYWVGWVLAYTQWYTRYSFKEITNHYPCSKLLLDYKIFHEMDITQIVDKIAKSISTISSLKKIRIDRNLTQLELSTLSGVPIRTIKAYEQNTLDITNAQINTIYALSKALHCSIEDLIK